MHITNASVKNIELFISPIKQTASLLEFNSVENSRYLLLFQDCTMIREMERETQEKEKFSSIGRMATGIAHELRNPLSSIGGSIQLLDLKHKDNAENKRLMEIALREISRLNRIIGEFLDYSADENSVINKVEPIHINPVLEELLDSVRVNPKWDGITHHVTLKSQGLVQGNVDKLKQIFWNIIKNACEAMESKKEGLLELECFDDDTWVVIRVTDNGTGLKDDDRDRMYEPFFSKKAQGTGLGLAIARKQIEFYKGDISHQNRESGGTVCTIRFPIQPSFFPEEMAKRKTA